MSLNRALLQAGALVIALSLTACPSNPTTGPHAATSPTIKPAFSTGPGCDTVRSAMFGWFPHDLPLPKGTFASLKLAGSEGSHRGMLIVPLGIRRFHHFITARWTAAGYVLGRIAVGHNQFSGAFVKGPARGAFVVHVDCRRVLQLYLGYTAGSPSPSSP